MRDNWVGLLLFAAGILAGIVLVAMLPGMPWSATALVLDLPVPTDQHDLDAQRSMAAAAWYMVAVTTISSLFGGLGLYLIFRTLQAAQRSAVAAENAVAQAELTTAAAMRSADESAKAAAVAREMGIAQTRAYVIVSNVQMSTDAEMKPTITITFTNSGQTPAKILNAGVRAGLYRKAEGGGEAEVGAPLDETTFLPELAGGKDDVVSYVIPIVLTLREQEDMRSNTAYLSVVITVRYSTVFEIDRQRERFAFRTKGTLRTQWRSGWHRLARVPSESSRGSD